MKCNKHEECRKVKGSGENWLEIVNCPWCDFQVSTSNIGKWCAGCYVKFQAEGGWIHFGKRFQKSFAEALAIAISKSGGAKIGKS